MRGLPPSRGPDVRAVAGVVSDLLRTCPGCQHVNAPDSVVCVECGTRLLDERVQLEKDLATLQAAKPPSVFDDPEWRKADIERSDAHPWRADKFPSGPGRGPKRRPS